MLHRTCARSPYSRGCGPRDAAWSLLTVSSRAVEPHLAPPGASVAPDQQGPLGAGPAPYPRARRPEMPTATTIKRTYYTLLLGNTLAASLIWGINTIFLLDAGLNNFEAFAANAFFTAGMVVVRGADGDRRRHVGSADLLPARDGDAGGDDRALRPSVGDRGPVLGVGRGLAAAGPRLHLLLGRDRGLAGRRARRRPLRGNAGVRPRPRAGAHGGGDADRVDRRRLSGPGDQPRGAVRPPSSGPRGDVRAGVRPDAGHRLHAQEGRPSVGGDQGHRRELDRVRLAGARRSST